MRNPKKQTVKHLQARVDQLEQVISQMYLVDIRLRKEVDRCNRLTIGWWILRGYQWLKFKLTKPAEETLPIPKGFEKKADMEVVKDKE